MKYIVKFKQIVTDGDLGIQIKLSHQGKLATAVGVSRQYISGIIKGQYIISEKMYLKIKDYISKTK